MRTQDAYFHEFIRAQEGRLIVQPRMGFSDFDQMRYGLSEVKKINAASIGTITLDSFTRTGDFESAQKAIAAGDALNGYPIVSYGADQNRRLLEGLQDQQFPVQVRHGCSRPEAIFRACIDAGIDATEGGPISYCFPYGRVPLKESITAWKYCSDLFAAVDKKYHLESFGGCMMGQLCPPAMLIAITTIEALFFKQTGIRSYSISLAQGSNTQQDIGALMALRRIAEKYLGSKEEWHVVYYTFMGKFPETLSGARAIMKDSVLVAKAGGAQRLIVKTIKEAHQIPTIADNIEALESAHQDFETAIDSDLLRGTSGMADAIFAEADFLIDLVLNLDANLDRAIAIAFKKGYWDVPYCLHQDNSNMVQSKLGKDGQVLWSDAGKIPFPKYLLKQHLSQTQRLSSAELLQMLSYNQVKYDALNTSPTVEQYS